MQTSEVQIPVGGAAMKAYVARPDGEASAPAVIVIQEIFGVTDSVRRIAELLAAAGYVAVAPAIFHRTDPDFIAEVNDEGMQRGRAAAAELTRDDLRADLEATIAWLRTQPFVAGPIATWGFCFGGSVAYYSASLPGVDAAVSFYGGQIAKMPYPGRTPMIDVTPQIQAPVFLAFGAQDPSIPPAEIEAIETALNGAGKTYELHVYPDENHAFFRQGVGPEGRPGAREVWPLVQAFLARHLRAHAGVRT